MEILSWNNRNDIMSHQVEYIFWWIDRSLSRKYLLFFLNSLHQWLTFGNDNEEFNSLRPSDEYMRQ